LQLPGNMQFSCRCPGDLKGLVRKSYETWKSGGIKLREHWGHQPAFFPILKMLIDKFQFKNNGKNIIFVLTEHSFVNYQSTII
jgi:hypothetical protein